MGKFTELLCEDKETAKVIRTTIKKELGLGAKDVSVKKKMGGYSSSVNVSIKTLAGLLKFSEIESIGNANHSYERDEATQEILAGGNTFIFVDIDYKFSNTLDDMIQAAYEKEKLIDGFRKILFNKIQIDEDGGKYTVSFIKSVNGKRPFVQANDEEQIKYAVSNIIRQSGDYSIYKSLK